MQATNLEPYEPFVWSGRKTESTLYLDDVSAIPFLEAIEGVEEYQHRARTRASDHDLFVAVTEPVEGYEHYCQVQLGLGSPHLIVAESTGNPCAVATASALGSALDEIVAHARSSGELNIHPYMSIESVWDLARLVQERSGASVQVVGPPPPVTWIANDKRLFSEVVSGVLDERWIVETHASRDPDELGGLLCELGARHRRVALKRTRCASSMGNAVFDSRSIGDRLSACKIVRTFLQRTEWSGTEDVLAVAWEDAHCSPSTQLWIPPKGHGNVRLDGIYVQILKGEEQVFVGSRPTTLPEAVNQTIGEAAVRVGAAFQDLGYVGRCSFDHLVLGDIHGDYQVVFTECNGRWGGTSTPMNLVERLVGKPRPPYRAQDFVDDQLIGVPFLDILDRVGEQAYDVRTGTGRFVFYNVGPLRTHGKLDVIAFGDSQEAAEHALEVEFPQLLGL